MNDISLIPICGLPRIKAGDNLPELLLSHFRDNNIDISSGDIIGLSKINRIVDYFCRRPQVQERLTEQIAEELKNILHTEDVAVIVEAEHMCVAMRGVKDEASSTVTSSFHGKFLDDKRKDEFLTYVYNGKL